MIAAPPEVATIPLTASVVTIAGQAGFDCLICRSSLDLIQPDPNHPDHLLGTCTGCGAWHPIVCLPGGARAVIAPLAVAEMADRIARVVPPSRADVA